MPSSEDNAVLADIIRRAYRQGVLVARPSFFPSYGAQLQPGDIHDPDMKPIDLTDEEIEILRRALQ